MIEIQGLAHVGVRVRKLAQSRGFYERLGFERLHEDPRDQVLVMRHPSGVDISLQEAADMDNAGRNVLVDWPDRYPGYTHVALRVASLENAQETLRAAAIKTTEGPVVYGDGTRAVFVRDPDGNVIELDQVPALKTGSEDERDIRRVATNRG